MRRFFARRRLIVSAFALAGALGVAAALFRISKALCGQLVGQPICYVDALVTQVRPGSIILIHAMYNSRAVARAAVPLILAGLDQRGYRAVSASELLRHASPGAS